MTYATEGVNEILYLKLGLIMLAVASRGLNQQVEGRLQSTANGSNGGTPCAPHLLPHTARC